MARVANPTLNWTVHGLTCGQLRVLKRRIEHVALAPGDRISPGGNARPGTADRWLSRMHLTRLDHSAAKLVVVVALVLERVDQQAVAQLGVVDPAWHHPRRWFQ